MTQDTFASTYIIRNNNRFSTP